MQLHTILLEMGSPDQLARLWIKQIMMFIKDKMRDTSMDFAKFPVPTSQQRNYPELDPLYVEISGPHRPLAMSRGMYHPRTKWDDPAFISFRLIVPEKPTGAELAKLQERIYQSLRHEIEHHQQMLRKTKDAEAGRCKPGTEHKPNLTGCSEKLSKQIEHFLLPLEIDANVVTVVKYAKAHKIPFRHAMVRFLSNALITSAPEDMDTAFKIVYPYFKQYARERFPELFI